MNKFKYLCPVCGQQPTFRLNKPSKYSEVCTWKHKDCNFIYFTDLTASSYQEIYQTSYCHVINFWSVESNSVKEFVYGRSQAVTRDGIIEGEVVFTKTEIPFFLSQEEFENFLIMQ